MKVKTLAIVLGLAALFVPLLSGAGEQVEKERFESLSLPKPQTGGGAPLMKVLKERKSLRTFDSEKLSAQVMSNMLWAAFGVNRPESGKRTAPSAVNRQEMDIYVATADGLYFYDATAHALKPILQEDVRALTGTQPYVKDAPVNLVYVADYSRMGQATDEQKVFYSAAATGFISQNVYLYCASEGLATVVRASIDKPALGKAMKLGPNQKITLAQSVGYPLSARTGGTDMKTPEPKVIVLESGPKEYVRVLGGPPETVTMRSGLVVLAPGKSIGNHNTESYEEVIVVLEGAGKMVVKDGSVLELKAGSVAYCPPRTEHDVTCTGEDQLRYLYVVANTEREKSHPSGAKE